MRTLLICLALHAACDQPEAAEPAHAAAADVASDEDREPPEAPREREEPAEVEPPPAPTEWHRLLGSYVAEGAFRYESLHESDEDRALLEHWLQAVAEAKDEGWEDAEALAFYVNAYNALVVAAVLEHWPVESVMRIEGFFDTAEHRVAGRELTLNQLEREILRSERFGEPRVHFVVSCASKSCPPRAPAALTADSLEERLTSAAEAYVRATTEVTSRKATVSRLFEWFAEDFGGQPGVRAFVADRLEGEAAERARSERTTLAYHDYDWSLDAPPTEEE